MRLLHTSTLKLHEFFDDQIPFYVILSHTWGDEEVTLQDLGKEESKNRAGYAKITGCCALALSSGWEWVWIDTCCIDKTSSADLSEAINSMYRWYRDSQVCYAYLTDCVVSPWISIDVEFSRSRWFTRGWTLQELLAPGTVIFYDRGWREIGTKRSLKSLISYVTGISSQHMTNPQSASIAAKMSWASKRRTSRVEDVAYSLLGIFDVNMPLLYGEGNNAFKRLQRELIAARSDDESIYAWRDDVPGPSGMLAHSPVAFTNSSDIRALTKFDESIRPPRVNGNKLVINGISKDAMNATVTLHCVRQSKILEPLELLGIRLVKWDKGYYMRADPSTLLQSEYPCDSEQPTPSGFYNSTLEVWLDGPYLAKTYSAHHGFHVHLPLLKQGFRLSDCSHLWLYDGCWHTSISARDVRVMMFIGDTGAKFSLILVVRDNLPSVDVDVPRETDAWSLEEITERYEGLRGSKIGGLDELFKPLRGENHVFVTLRKKVLNGEKVNVVDVSITQERSRQERVLRVWEGISSRRDPASFHACDLSKSIDMASFTGRHFRAI